LAISGFKLHKGDVVERVWFGDRSNLHQQESFLVGAEQRECFPLRQNIDGMSLYMVGLSDQGNWTSNQPVDVEMRGSEGGYFAAWAESRGWRVEAAPSGERRFLAATSRLAELNDRTPEQALFLVEDKLAHASTQLSFLGFNVSNEFLVFAPLVLLFLVSYLVVHLSHAIAVAGRQERPTSPWIGLFEDRVSGYLTIGSLLVAPIVGVVVASKLRLESALACVGEIVVVALLFVQAARSLEAIHWLRKTLGVPSLWRWPTVRLSAVPQKDPVPVSQAEDTQAAGASTQQADTAKTKDTSLPE
jgi:hypothetical protein